MTMNDARLRTRVFAWLAAAVCGLAPLAIALSVLVSSAPVGAQEDTRRLWDSAFLSKREPSKSKPRPRKAPDTAWRHRRRRRPTPRRLASSLGVTVWRLRRSKASDSGDSRLLVQETENQRTESVEWTPERVEAETPFSAGDRVRLSIESPRAGYLYVVDRELYADGTTSDPYLIFPTQRMRDGDNSVRAGKVIELPDKSAFKLTPLRSDYQGERLTILVTSEPLPQVTVPADAERLDPVARRAVGDAMGRGRRASRARRRRGTGLYRDRAGRRGAGPAADAGGRAAADAVSRPVRARLAGGDLGAPQDREVRASRQTAHGTAGRRLHDISRNYLRGCRRRQQGSGPPKIGRALPWGPGRPAPGAVTDEHSPGLMLASSVRADAGAVYRTDAERGSGRQRTQPASTGAVPRARPARGAVPRAAAGHRRAAESARSRDAQRPPAPARQGRRAVRRVVRG